MRWGRAVVWALCLTALAWWLLPPLYERTAPRIRESMFW